MVGNRGCSYSLELGGKGRTFLAKLFTTDPVGWEVGKGRKWEWGGGKNAVGGKEGLGCGRWGGRLGQSARQGPGLSVDWLHGLDGKAG